VSRDPLRDEPPLLEPDVAIRLARGAVAYALSPGPYEGLGRGSVTSHRLAAAADDAFWVALDVAIDTGDPRVLDAVLEAAGGLDDLSPHHDFADAAAAIVPQLPAITNELRDAARSASGPMRAAVATALARRAVRSLAGRGDATDAEAARIVAALACDIDGEVRKAARTALGAHGAPAWAPFFDTDPLRALPAAEAARLRRPLDRAAAVMEAVVPAGRTVAPALAALPDELALPFCEHFVRTRFAFIERGASAVVDRWLRPARAEDRVAGWLLFDGEVDYGAHERALLRR
jgi:hypothetical protein